MFRLFARFGAAAGTMVLALSATSVAWASGFAIREQSAAGLGASFAGEGTPGMGLSAMFWNPAAVTQTSSLSVDVNYTYIGPTTKLTAVPGTSASLLALGAEDSIAKPGHIPTVFLGYKINDQWFAGLSLDAPYGLSSHADSWAGQQLAQRAEAVSAEVTPVVGTRIGDMLSIAAGPRVLWFKGTFSRTALGVAGAPVLPVEVVADDVGYGFVVGATITPTPSTEIAIGYRSQVKLNLEGHNTFAISPIFGPFSGTKNAVRGDITLPDQANIGLRQRFGDLSLLGTAEWIGWNVVQKADFIYTGGLTPGANAGTLNFDYRDGWFFSVGAEYAWRPDTILRAGIGRQLSPITDKTRNPSLPESDSWQPSAGLSQRLDDHASVDLAYSYVSYPEAAINVTPAHADYPILLGKTLLARADAHAHILSAGFRYNW